MKDSWKTLYPFESRFVSIRGLQYHYLDEGQGDPLILLHGNPTWSFFYRDLIKGLRPDYRVLAPDHIGCGLSEKPADGDYPFTLQRRAEDLRDFLDTLGLKQNLSLVLHDWGGMIGMLYATRHPERVKRLIILNTSAFRLPREKPLPVSLRLSRTPLGALLIRGLNAFSLGASYFCARKKMPSLVRQGYLAPYANWDQRRAVLRFVQDIPLNPSDSAYPLVAEVERNLSQFRDRPILICWGGKDFVFDRSFLNRWVQYLPQAEVHEFPEAGHYLLEDAAEEVLETILPFLQKNPLATIRFETPNENVARHIDIQAESEPDRPALILTRRVRKGKLLQAKRISFRELREKTDRLSRGLQEFGIGKGVRTVLMVKPSEEFFTLVFALFKAGAIIVMIDPGIGLKNLKKCLEEAQPQAFIGIPKANVARVLFAWGRKSLRTKVQVGGIKWPGMLSLKEIERAGMDSEKEAFLPQGASALAAILFSSGSTGVPKGAIYTHGIFSAQVEALKRVFGIRPGEIDLPTFPLFALFDPALGMTAVIPDMDPTRPGQVDPENIVEAIHSFQVTNMFGSPALLDRVGRFGAPRGITFPTLKRVLSAGAPVAAAILDTFSKMLPQDAEIFTPYGATEALPVAVIGSKEVLSETREQTERGAGVCVGRPVADIKIFIIPIRDESIENWSDELILAPGKVGEIVVRGPVVSASYYRRPQSNLLAKIRGRSGEVFHRMGDLGYFDDKGRLWYCGRKSQRVSLKEKELFTDPCEGIFNAHPKVKRTALVGAERGVERFPVLCVELEEGVIASDKDRIQRELLEMATAWEMTREIHTVLFHPSFPVDIRHNAKIFREKLAEWAGGKLH